MSDRLKASQLTRVQGGMMLATATATAWAKFEAASIAERKIDPLISSPGGAWRSEAMVRDMWLNPKKYGATKGVAVPRSMGGPGSVHEYGRSVDINNWRRYGLTVASATRNLDALANRFGFRRTIAKEPWHYVHDGVTASGGGSNADSTEDDKPLEGAMASELIYNLDTKTYAVCSPGVVITYDDSFKVRLQEQHGPAVQLHAHSFASRVERYEAESNTHVLKALADLTAAVTASGGTTAPVKFPNYGPIA